MFSEYDVLKTLDHPNIMRMYNLLYDSRRFFLVTELFNGGDLFEKIETDGPFSEA
jgi:calcium-dependent protein kinase